MDNKPLVSIIIPVYNCEKYVEGCLNSATSQTYGNIEIIAVNDGSEDGSERILKELAEKDSRIHIIIKENGGPSSARNAGLESCNGDYITFLDCDDELYNNSIETMVNALDDSVDYAAFSYDRLFNRKSSEVLSPAVFTLDDLKSDFEKYNSYFMLMCSKLYKRSIIEKNNIRFDENIHFSEDYDFNLKYANCCTGSFIASDKSVYLYYICRSGKHEKRDYTYYRIKTVEDFFNGRENMPQELYLNTVKNALIGCVNRTMSWYGVKKTAEYAELSFSECKDYITGDILESAFGKEQADSIINNDYLAFTKRYFKEHKENIYNKYRLALSRCLVKLKNK